MCEPLACALHGVEASEAVDGDRIVVLGRGALGRMLAAALAGRGLRRGRARAGSTPTRTSASTA